MSATPEPELVCVADYERAAQGRLSGRARAFIDGGAGDELTLADNVAAWSRLALAPRMLAGVASADPAVTLLGRRRPHPVLVAPIGHAALLHPEAELAIAQACAATATTMCLATLASVSPARLAEVVPEVSRWFQLYVPADHGLARELIANAAAAGCEALVITVDRPVLGIRERERRLGVRAAIDAAHRELGAQAAVLAAPDDPALTWDGFAALAGACPLPILAKGILTARDARRAVEHGAAGVIVSNHGGRQLDPTLSGADALPAVVDAVADAAEVLVDGGIRRGTDVVKALALGARAVLVGRPPLWGLGVAGVAGARDVLEILIEEVVNALTLCGVPSPAQLDRGFVAPAPWARP